MSVATMLHSILATESVVLSLWQHGDLTHLQQQAPIGEIPALSATLLICMASNPEHSGHFPPPSLPFINNRILQFIVINCTAGG